MERQLGDQLKGNKHDYRLNYLISYEPKYEK